MMRRISKVAKNAPSLNDSGYTLLEMILSLMIFMVMVSIIPIGLRTVFNDEVFESGIRSMEWEVFSGQIKKEIRCADEMTVQAEKISLKKDGKVILYEKYGSSMRRRVDDQGHEILIQNFSSFQFNKIPRGVQIFATDLNGDIHSTRAYNFISIGEVTP